MQVILPDNQNEITLDLYKRFMSLDTNAKNYEDLVFSLFTGISEEDAVNVPKKQKDEVLNHILKALSTDGEFKNRFTIDGIEFGLIPNFDNISGGEYNDLVEYSKDLDNSDLARLMAVLYRPIIKKDKFNNYSVEKYSGTEKYYTYMNKLPMSVVNGCLGFFLTLSNDLESHIQKCIREEQVKEALL